MRPNKLSVRSVCSNWENNECECQLWFRDFPSLRLHSWPLGLNLIRLQKFADLVVGGSKALMLFTIHSLQPSNLSEAQMGRLSLLIFLVPSSGIMEAHSSSWYSIWFNISTVSDGSWGLVEALPYTESFPKWSLTYPLECRWLPWLDFVWVSVTFWSATASWIAELWRVCLESAWAIQLQELSLGCRADSAIHSSGSYEWAL